MTIGLFWSRYELELHEKNLREIDAKYTLELADRQDSGKSADTDSART